MDKKRIIKNIVFIATVPAVVVIGYYGYKAFKHYKEKKAGNEGEEKSGADGEEEVKTRVRSVEQPKKVAKKKIEPKEEVKPNVNVITDGKNLVEVEQPKETKVIPITFKQEEKTETKIKVKEA